MSGKNAESYGYSIGVLLVNCKGTPFIPGDVANASTYDFPILYRTINDLSLDELFAGKDPRPGVSCCQNRNGAGGDGGEGNNE